MNPRIGSLCTGYGGLEMAARALWPDARVVWCSEYDPEPDNKDSGARFLKWRYPDVPNHGNLRTMQWEDIEPVDILTAGFPCQSISVAGKQRGTDDDRWLFDDIAHGIGRMAAPPGLLLFENVPRLLTVQHGHAMARVVHRLAALGYVGQWRTVRASDVGACHRRERVVIVARHADSTDSRERWLAGSPQASDRGSRSDACGPGGVPATRADGELEPGIREGALGGQSQAPTGDRGRDTGLADGLPADAPGDGRHEGRPGTARVVGGSDAALGGSTAADPIGHERARERLEQPGRVVAARGGGSADVAADPRGGGRVRGAQLGGAGRDETERREAGDLAELGDLAQWGRYGPAVRRHALALGRAAPSATVPRGLGGAQRLNPRFVEWMMMVPDGHVTDCPELTVNQMLRILGNGVVPPSIAIGAADLLRDLP